MKKFKYNITHSAYYIINENNKKLAIRKSKSLNYNDLIKSCDIGLSTVMIKKNLLRNDKLFSNFSTKEDYYLWLKLSKSGHIFNYINQPLSYWRKTKDSLSSSTFQKIVDSFKLYKHFEKNIFISFFRTIILSFNFLLKKKDDSRFI